MTTKEKQHKIKLILLIIIVLTEKARRHTKTIHGVINLTYEGEIHIYRSETFNEISKTVDRLSTHTQHMQDSDLFHTVERLKHFLNK